MPRDDDLDISEDPDHPVLSEEEDRDLRGGDPADPGPKPPEGPIYGSDPDLRERLHEFVTSRERPPRQDELWPYLLVRAFAGDTGRRSPPLGWFWESPDVIVVPGIVDTLEGNTPTLTPRAGREHTIFVRTWNLGRFPAPAAKVRVWWANPAFAFVPGSPNGPEYIGGASVDLEDQYHFPGCRALVRIPQPWVPVEVNGGHECLLAKVEAFGDRAGPGWRGATDRHVGQRNLTVLSAEGGMELVLERLNAEVPWEADVHFIHGMGAVGPVIEAQGAVFQEQFGMTAPSELPSQAYLMEDGQGHLGAVSLADGDVRFLPGEEAAALLPERRLQREDLSREGGAPDGLLDEVMRVILDTSDLSAGTVADRLGTGSAHLLRVVVVAGGRRVGGYSVVVAV